VLGRTWGRRGELSAVSLSAGAERFSELREVYLFGPAGMSGTGRRMDLESVWDHRGGLIFKFRGIDCISDAEALTGSEVRIPASARRVIEPGEYFESDLVGCEVFERLSGERVGVVKALQQFGGPPLLDVEGPDGSVPIPFARAICPVIDIEARKILVDLPEGLKELSR
jgi:16S rRNA processing protein RimM